MSFQLVGNLSEKEGFWASQNDSTCIFKGNSLIIWVKKFILIENNL